MENKIARKRVILQLVNTLDYGGATVYALVLLECLEGERYTKLVAHGPGNMLLDRAAECSDMVYELSSMNPSHTNSYRHTWFGDLKAAIALIKVLKTYRVDILHSHGSKTRFLGGLAGMVANVPVRIQSAHGFSFNSDMSFIKRKLLVVAEKCLGACYHCLVLETDYDLKIARKYGFGRKQRCIYTGIDFKGLELKRNATTTIRAELGISPSALVVTMVGRLADQKDPHTFVRTANIVCQQNEQVYFLVVGDGPLRESTSSLIMFPERILMLGERSDVPQLLGSSNIFMLCSRWEGIPLTVLFAMYLRVPVIATDILGLPEVVVDGVTGRLASEGDEQSYAGCVFDLLKDRRLRDEIGNSAHKLVRDRHSLVKMISEFEALYRG